MLCILIPAKFGRTLDFFWEKRFSGIKLLCDPGPHLSYGHINTSERNILSTWSHWYQSQDWNRNFQMKQVWFYFSGFDLLGVIQPCSTSCSFIDNYTLWAFFRANYCKRCISHKALGPGCTWGRATYLLSSCPWQMLIQIAQGTGI